MGADRLDLRTSTTIMLGTAAVPAMNTALPAHSTHTTTIPAPPSQPNSDGTRCNSDTIIACQPGIQASIRSAHEGQYLAPSGHHLPVRRYVHPDTSKMFEREAQAMGFTHAAVGATVRSSHHANKQTLAAGVGSVPAPAAA